jgi:phage tail-like protein
MIATFAAIVRRKQMRKMLASPHPLVATLPSMLREDDFAKGLCASFDGLLAPVLLTLDAFTSYLDPATTPEDMIPWLAQWLGLGLDPNVPAVRQRHELQIAGVLATRGTRASIATELENALGIPVEVTESGGARWSPSPGGPLPGEPQEMLRVIIHPAAGQEVDLDRLDVLIRSVKPAHVRHQVSMQPT